MQDSVETYCKETSLFGVRLHSTDMPSATALILTHARSHRGGLVCVANVDMVTRAKRDPKLFGIMHDALLAVTDSVPLVWALKRAGYPGTRRVYGPDLMLELCRKAAFENVPIFLFGGSEREMSLLQPKLKATFPELNIVGAVSPPMLPVEPPFDSDIVRRIGEAGAQLVFVGLGCPKQEYWMHAHAHALQAVTIGVGYAFAQIAGLKPRAPKWMHENGLEWLFRVFQEPKRLWFRYLVGNSLFVWYFLAAMGRKLFFGR